MQIDICGCPISLQSNEALEAWNGVVLAILSHGRTAPVHLGKLLELEPEFAMGHAIKGLATLMLARRELVSVAEDANRQAQLCLGRGGATQRERLWCRALDSWLAGNPEQSIAAMEDAVALRQGDTISMKLSHGIRFMLGDHRGMLRAVKAVIGAHGEDHPLRGYALGCLAFAQEENGLYREAERSGLQALDYAKDDAWGLHAVAHVYDMTHRTECGIKLIDSNVAAWDHCNNFRFHVWWHKALLLLDQRDYGAVLDLYDRQIRSEKTDDYRDFSNASSLLVRLELDGVNVGDRWAELADLAEARVADGCLVFADLHYMLALVGDKRDTATEAMIARVAQSAQGTDSNALIMRDPGQAAARGLASFGEGQYDVAFANLAAAQPKFQIMGGSHAQRDVFERLTIEAGIRAGQLDAASGLLQQRIDQRAGEQDRFASSRLQMIADSRLAQAQFAAE
ncbi:MAG: tetratricopeptide repeat protein [Pseudomonadota bacterium]